MPPTAEHLKFLHDNESVCVDSDSFSARFPGLHRYREFWDILNDPDRGITEARYEGVVVARLHGGGNKHTVLIVQPNGNSEDTRGQMFKLTEIIDASVVRDLHGNEWGRDKSYQMVGNAENDLKSMLDSLPESSERRKWLGRQLVKGIQNHVEGYELEEPVYGD
jgi:hypothetical protein